MNKLLAALLIVVGVGASSAQSDKLVTVYGADWCGWCHEEVKELTRMHIPYVYRDVKDSHRTDIRSLPTLFNTFGQRHAGYLSGDDLAAFAEGKYHETK